MSNNKKDLTRIEDLGEYLHELEADVELPQLNDFASELPDIPSTPETELEDETPFDEASLDFSTNEDPIDVPGDEPSIDFGSSFDEETTLVPESAPETVEEDQTASWNTNISLTEIIENKDDETSFSLQKEETPEVKEPEDYKPSIDFKTPETFEDLKKFSESAVFSSTASEANPSFSILIKNVRYSEDVNDIVTLLKEFNLLSDSEEQIKGRLMRGMLLIPRISEFAAIYVAHKLRRFDVDIQLGLSDEIHPPKHQESPETGIVSKASLFQNQTHHFHFDDPKLELSQIIVAATSSLEGYKVIRYIGVASEHKMLDSYIVEDENSTEIPQHYQELAMKLKAHALKAQSNAVVGLNYQLTPIPSEFGVSGHKYRLTCTGNLVWINKL